VIDHFACWHDLDWVVFDVETTGFGPEHHRIVEVAAVRMRRGQVVGQFVSYINPQRYIPQDVSRIHGITDSVVREAPRFVDVLTSIVPLMGDAMPVSYGEAFDRSFVRGEMARLSLGELPNPAMNSSWKHWVDPLAWVRSLDRFAGPQNTKPSNKLVEACARWNIRLASAHRAEDDAIAAGQLLWAMAPYIGRMTASELLRRQELLGGRKEDVGGPGNQDPSPSRSDEGP